MTFEEFRLRVHGNALSCGGATATAVLVDGTNRADRLIAAAAMVVDDYGAGWAIRNRESFEREIFKYLGWGARLALLFVGGPWGMAARLLIPVIIEVISRQFAQGYGSTSADFSRMRIDANKVLKG